MSDRTGYSKRFRLPFAAACAALPLLLAGCGGGASEQPTVTLKPRAAETPQVVNGPPTPENGAPAAGVGGWKGRVVFGGALPQLAPLIRQFDTTVKNHEVCAAMDVPNESLVGENGGVANVFIYLPRRPARASVPAVPEEPVEFDQRGCVFLPHALLVRVNQEVQIKSDDPIPHNTRTEPRRNTKFSEVIKPDDRVGVKFTYPLAETEPVGVKCDFHVWMQAYHLPLDHPFAAVSEADGTFEIQGLPAGPHEFSVWHEGAGGYLLRNHKVTITAGETLEENIDYPAGKFVADAQPSGKTVTLSSLIRK